MSIFRYLDYRKYLTEEFETRRKNLPSFTLGKVAAAAEIQNTYLTNALKGRANLNSDQIFAIARFLGLNELESHYLFLLKELDQSVSAARKKALQKEIDGLRAKGQKSESHLTAQAPENNPDFLMRYYGDPHLKIIHLLLQIPRYAQDPRKIEPELRLEKSVLDKGLTALVELGLIRFEGKAVEVLRKNFHLPKDSPILLAHQSLMRMKSSERISALSPERRYSFSVTFSTTEEVRAAIHDEFLGFLKKIEKMVKGSEGVNAYQMNFDLFPWSSVE